MSKKEEFFKDRFKQALDSTYKVISEELHNLSKKEKDELLVSGTIQIVAINKEFKVKRINKILKNKFFQNK